MIVPKRLVRGSTIGLIAPSSAVEVDKVKESIKAVEHLGYRVKVGPSCYERYGYLSGSDEIRSRDINMMFEDESVDGIFCIRGGYGTIRIMDMIDFDMIKKNPKIFVGYSDITTLHIAFNQLCNFVTYHGPMPSVDMVDSFKDFSRSSLFEQTVNKDSNGEIKNPKGYNLQTYNGGIAKGQLIGGNLSLIVSTLGTPYEIDTKSKILFIEDIDEEPYSVDRMLSQLRLSGKLDDAAGILIGDFCDCVPRKENSLSLENAIDDVLCKVDKPIIKGIMAGHCAPMITLALGKEIIFDADKLSIRYT